MSDDKKQTQQPETFGTSLLLNGKPATREEATRILRTPAPVSDPNDRATKPISTTSRGFNLLK
jgi:hypothetical protein